MSRIFNTQTLATLALGLAALASIPSATASVKKIKRTKPAGADYAAFSQALSKEDRIRHALDRLTFGPRPGDFERAQAMGLEKWLDRQMHPERGPESAVLEQRLLPLESLQMSNREAFLHYPSRQMIVAVARGRGPLPEDPELRAIVVRLADRYLERKDLPPSAQLKAAQEEEEADLNLRMKLTDILTDVQIDQLRNGNGPQKRMVLESVPQEKWADFAWALTRKDKEQLNGLATEGLRRQMLLTINPQRVLATDMCQAKILRAAYSEHQLQELMVDFWFNHFNVFMDKGADRYLGVSYEREAIRPYVFGKFSDMLLATAQSPAMLFYLDNWESAAPQQIDPRRPQGKNRQRGLNENYGRELLELHTMGVDGGYTQKDVTEVARCFTGWTIAKPGRVGEFEYNDKLHDHAEKLVLGHVIPAGGGMNDALKVLDILAHHPATAHYISLCIAKRFVSDNPPPELVNRMADAFLKSGGDLRKVMETMIYAGEFWSAGSYRAKVKTPFEMVVSAVRATNADVEFAMPLANQIQKLGEPLYRKIEPTGYSSANAEWVSSASLLDRMNFAIALAHNRVPGVTVDLSTLLAMSQHDPLDLVRSILDQDPSERTKAAIQKVLGAQDMQQELAKNAQAGPPKVASLIAGLSIGSPEFQRR